MVIGGTGFIGPYVVKEFLDHGEDVVVADWMPDPEGLGHLDLDKRVKVVKLNILDYQAVVQAIKDNEVEYIVNMANARELSKVEPKEQRRARGGGWTGIKVSTDGTRNVLEAARALDIKRVVYVSSTGVYGNLPSLGRPLNEDDPTAPVLSGYVAKRLGEIICEEYNELYDLDCLTVRYGGQVYGPRLFRDRSGMKGTFKDSLFFAILDLFTNGVLGRSCTVTDPDFVKAWLYVKDAGRATYMALNSDRIKTRLFNTSGTVHTNREVAEMVKKYVPDCTVNYEESDRRSSLSSEWKYAFDFSRAKDEFGWEPIYDIDEGVRDWANYQRGIAGIQPI